MANIYHNQVRLLLDVLPHIQKDNRWALKGGTAINLFYRNMPRLSVDIDLTYLPVEPREITLNNIAKSLASLSVRIEKAGYRVHLSNTKNRIFKIFVFDDTCTIKIEPNTVIRGSVFPLITKELVAVAQNEFQQTQKVLTLSHADVYGGKICAALDRQHPRDLFDIKILLEKEGITDAVRTAFIFYLISSNRPIHELLSPNEKNILDTYQKEFAGMTKHHVSLDSLVEARRDLIQIINTSLTENEKGFLMSIRNGDPKWDLIDVPHLKTLPSIQWKLENIKKTSAEKNIKYLGLLEDVLYKQEKV